MAVCFSECIRKFHAYATDLIRPRIYHSVLAKDLSFAALSTMHEAAISDSSSSIPVVTWCALTMPSQSTPKYSVTRPPLPPCYFNPNQNTTPVSRSWSEKDWRMKKKRIKNTCSGLERLQDYFLNFHEGVSQSHQPVTKTKKENPRSYEIRMKVVCTVQCI